MASNKDNYFNAKAVERAWTIKESGVYIDFPSFQAALDYVRGRASEPLTVKKSVSMTESMARDLEQFAAEGDLFYTEVFRAGLEVVMRRRKRANNSRQPRNRR